MRIALERTLYHLNRVHRKITQTFRHFFSNNKSLTKLNIVLILFGLSRVFFINSWGMVDAEWWRAWMSHIQDVGFRNIYSDTTDSIALFSNLSNPIVLPSGFKTFPFIDIPEFNANLYAREIFPIAQPPLFYVDLLSVVSLKALLAAYSDYQILNITNIFWSLILTLSFGLFLKKLRIDKYATYALIFIWANPLLILQSNIQGYRDLLLVTFITLSLMLSQSLGIKPYIAGLCFGAACLTKPTALFMLPLFFLIFNRGTIRKMFAGSSFALVIAIAIYAYLQKLYGLTAAMLTEMSISNSWSEGISLWSPFRIMSQYSNYLPFSSDYNEEISNLLYTLLRRIGFLSSVYFIAFLILAIVLKRTYKPDFFSPIVPLFTFLLYISNPSSRMNHYLVFVPIWLIGLTKKSTRSYSMLILIVFLVQDFLYAGLGRNSAFDGTEFYPIVNFSLTFASIIVIIFVWKLKRCKMVRT